MVKNTAASLDKFIDDFAQSGGAEMSNTQLFIERLCEVLSLPKPDPAKEQNHLNDYVFERSVNFKHPDGTQTKGRIDLYKRNSFILEAKQSAKRGLTKYNPDQHVLIPEDHGTIKAGTAKRGTRNWDTTMVAARKQAENYARALPVEHGYPPFLLVADIGHVIEVYADFSGQGKNYAHFPDRQSYRIYLDDLRDEKIQTRLRAIWTEPQTLDPTRISAEVTRDIADRLAIIAKRLEKKHDPKEVAEFLMRCLFTMFAEDVKLLPENSFTELLEKIKATPKNFKPALEDLWRVMDEGGYSSAINASLKRFNGSLFKKRHAIALEPDDINELWIAAKKKWQNVEPAIFGTLLERALDTRERSKLGAHYTPRAYVERLVIPTLIVPLRQEWEEVQAHVQELQAAKQTKEAIAAVKDYHHRLCTTRVLDPACGTGNFLYISLELMKKLEGEVLEALDSLGYKQGKLEFEGETVNPRQFFGLELNPRAMPIADLVLWIGYLKWQLRTNGLKAIAEPVLHAYGTIKQQDAILAYDKQQELTDENGKPLTRWDGHTMKRHPITGEEIPDPEAQIPLYSYANPRPAKWPEAEYIVGNPPFIGNKRMIQRLGEGYVKALRGANSDVPDSADLVMYWWAKSAALLLKKKIRQFGFVTTNSITQTFNRRVVEQAIGEKASLIFAVADHPWVDEEGSAAVRVAMTTVDSGKKKGSLLKVIVDGELNNGVYENEVSRTEFGHISSLLKLGADIAFCEKLQANALMAHQGVIPSGTGFRLSGAEMAGLGLSSNNLPSVVKSYAIGRDLADRPSEKYIIDFFGLEKEAAATKYPQLFQRILDLVKPERDQVRREKNRDNFWLFVEPRKVMRSAMVGLESYIATCRTAKHRIFSKLSADVLADAKIIAITLGQSHFITTLSSRLHILYANSSSARLGVGNDSIAINEKVVLL